MKNTSLFLFIVSLFLFCSTVYAEKVVVVPLNTGAKVAGTDSRLWGQGRPGSGLFPYHAHADGYCTTSAGTKFSLSEILVSWDSSDAACPLGTWVCSIEDIGTQYCGIIAGTYLRNITCSGSGTPTSTDWLRGWVVDVDDDGQSGASKYTDSGAYTEDDICSGLRVWCCWK